MYCKLSVRSTNQEYLNGNKKIQHNITGSTGATVSCGGHCDGGVRGGSISPWPISIRTISPWPISIFLTQILAISISISFTAALFSLFIYFILTDNLLDEASPGDWLGLRSIPHHAGICRTSMGPSPGQGHQQVRKHTEEMMMMMIIASKDVSVEI